MFVIEKVNSSFTAQGDGPIITATGVTISYPLDKAGTVSFDMPATDERATLLVPDTIQYVRIRIDGVAGPICIVKQQTRDTATQMLRLSGVRLLGELEHSHVGSLFLHGTVDTDPMPAVDVLDAILSGTGWTHSGVPSKAVYHQFGDETHLAALIKVATLLGDHLRESDTTPRHLEWLPTTTAGFIPLASGLRTVDVGTPNELEGNDDIALIVGGLQEVRDSFQRLTRIYPRGGGNQDARLFINSATNTLPTGFSRVVNTPRPDLSYIKYDATDVAGAIGATETFRDIAPVKNTIPDTVAAANMLQDAGVVSLRKRLVDQRSYKVTLTKVRKPLRQGEALFLECRHYSGTYGWIEIKEPVLVLEVKIAYKLDTTTYDVTVTQLEVDRWPVSDAQTLVQIGRDVKAALSHVQPVQRAKEAETASNVAATTPTTPIYARATQDTLAQSISNGTLTIVNFNAISSDPYSRITIGAAWKFTASVAGTYEVNAAVMFASTTTWADGEVARLDLYKNGAFYAFLDRRDNVNNLAVWMRLSGSDLVTLAISDYLDIRVTQASGAALSLTNSAGYNRVTVQRVV